MRTTAATSSSTEAARAGTTSAETAARAKTRLRRHVSMASPIKEPEAKADACYSEVRNRTTAAQLPRTDLSFRPALIRITRTAAALISSCRHAHNAAGVSSRESTMITRSAFILALLAATAPGASSAAAQEITLKFSHFLGPKSFFQLDVVEPWAKELEAKTNGRVTVETFDRSEERRV